MSWILVTLPRNLGLPYPRFSWEQAMVEAIQGSSHALF